MLHFLPLALLCGLAMLSGRDQSAGREQRGGSGESPSARGAEIVQHGGYPELRVDGAPFFIHSAAFFYSRIPRDLWETSLDQYRALGINTIDLYIIWNWHEPREGELDFDGHSNPRRDLRGLLELIARRGFKLIARPGPTILNEWRNGGYPAWLLERPEYGMPLADRLEGRYPPLAGLNVRDAEAAAQGWLDNAVHMQYARRWLAAVARELAPYRSHAQLTLPARKGSKEAVAAASGPLLFVQIEDDLALGHLNRTGPAFWNYVGALCRAVQEGGADVPCFTNPDDAHVAAAGSTVQPPMAAMGQWYLYPWQESGIQERTLGPEEVTRLEFAAETLGTQPEFPPALIEYNAAWYAPGDDARPEGSPLANTLLSTRLLLAHGLHGINYFPLQDTVFPAGYETPWTNRFYRWDSALTPAATRGPRARAVERTGQWLASWGSFLAATHKRADFGLLYPMGALPQKSLAQEDIQAVYRTAQRLIRLAQYAGLSVELLDPQHQPAEQLQRHALLLLPVVDSESPAYVLSEKAQRALVTYVRAGGTLVCFPGRPAGAAFEELWSARPAEPLQWSHGATAWTAGLGRVALLTKDFYSWVSLDDEPAAGRKRFESAFAISLLESLLSDAGIRPVVRRNWKEPGSASLVAAELVSNEGTRPLGERDAGTAVLSVTNASYDSPVSESLEVLSPEASARSHKATSSDYVPVTVNLPPHESLLLPVRFPLCTALPAGETCNDAIVAAGAELVRAERDSKIMQLTFYVPGRATLRLRLGARPGHVEIDEVRREAMWDSQRRELTLELTRGAAPELLRVLRIPLPYRPALPDVPHAERRHQEDWGRFTAPGAVRLPLGESASLPAGAPLFALESGREARMMVTVENADTSFHDAQLRLTGTLEASAGGAVPGGEFRGFALKVPAAKVEAAAKVPAGDNGLFPSALTLGSGPDAVASLVFFALIPPKGAAGYRYDLDRDGSEEWVLENAASRAIFSPAAGGRVVGFLEKAGGTNLASSAGLLEDAFAFTPNQRGATPERARGHFGTFNRAYTAEWVKEAAAPALRMTCTAPDIYPHGARIEKTVHLLDDRRLRVEYKARLLQADAPRLAEEAEGRIFAAPVPKESVPQSLVIRNSIPAEAGGGRGTRLCWQAPGAREHCELFVPGGDSLAPFPGATRVEVRTPGRPGLALDWSGAGAGARLTIEQKRYTVLLRLTFSALDPGGAEAGYRIEFTVTEAP